MKAIQMGIAEGEFDLKADLEALSRRQVRGFGAAYKEVCAEAERIARSKGCACLFNLHTDPIVIEEKGQVATMDDLQRQMAGRTALWAAPAMDITREVIDALNK